MRIIVNAASAHMGGAVTYLRSVLPHLPNVAPDDFFVAYVPSETLALLPSGLRNVELRSYPYGRTEGASRIYFDQVVLPTIARREGIDLLYSTTGFGTFLSRCPQVLLVRNSAYFDPLFHEKYQELGRSLRRNTIRRWYSLISAARADYILFPSHAIQAMLQRYLGLPNGRARVIHYGYNAPANSCDDESLPGSWRALRTWREEGAFILLNVSTYAVHKNLEVVVEAVSRVRRGGLDVRLATTTSREKTTDRVEYDALWRRARDLDIDKVWCELGYVPHRQLHTLYAEADLYLFPSFTESFGHSMVEAMAAGLPVIAAETPVNVEVCADAGTYFPAFDADACAAAVSSLLRDETRYRALASISKRRASTFSWRLHTEELVTLFREAADARPKAPLRALASRIA